MNSLEKLIMSLEYQVVSIENNSPLTRGDKGGCSSLFQRTDSVKDNLLNAGQDTPPSPPRGIGTPAHGESYPQLEDHIRIEKGVMGERSPLEGSGCSSASEGRRGVFSKEFTAGCLSLFKMWEKFLRQPAEGQADYRRKGDIFNPLLFALLITIITLFSVTQSVYAQTAAPIDRPQQLQILDSYFQIAVENNPELASLKREVDAQRQRVPQVEALPDPEINIGFYINPVMETDFSGRFSASAMQMFPWFGTLSARGQVEKSISEAIFHSANARQLEIFTTIKNLWLEYYQLNHHIHIHEELIGIVRDLENLVEIRYETGRAGQADLLRIQMEEQRLLNAIEQFEDEKNPLLEQFNALLNRDPTEGIEVPAELPERALAWSKEELYEVTLNRHPDFERLEARRQQFKNQVDLARLEGKPSFGVGLEYMGRDFGMMSMMELDHVFIGMATIQIPLYRNKYRAQRKEAQLQLQAADYLEIDMANKFRVELERAMKSLRDAQREHRLITEELRPRSEQALKILSEEYSTGRVSFDEVLQVLRELLALDLEKVEALTNQNKAMAEIEQLTANDLQNDRNKP